MTKTRLDYIQLAKELTGSNDINVIIAAAKELEAFASAQPTKEILGVPYSFAEFLPYYQHRYFGKDGPAYRAFEPYPFQTQFASTLDHYVLNSGAPLMHAAARQMGTTTMLGALAVWYALSSRRQSVMFVSNRMAMAHDVKNNIDFALAHLPPSFMADKPIMNNRNLMTFRNKSSIHYGSPSDATYSQMWHSDLIIMDNAAYFSYSESAKLENEVMKAVRRGAMVVISSCPGTNKGFFHTMWEESSPFNRVMHSWTLHPERDAEFAQRYLEQLGQVAFDQEFNCKFNTGTA